MSKTLYLVASVPTQFIAPCPAEELYVSHWFSMAKTYVATFSKEGDSWVILSAKHGVIDPSRHLKPYDEKDIARSRQKRQGWARTNVAELLGRTEPGDTIVLLAGPKYRENLIAPLEQEGRKVEIPMGDLKLSQQKAWMRKKLEEAGVSLGSEEEPKAQEPASGPEPE